MITEETEAFSRNNGSDAQNTGVDPMRTSRSVPPPKAATRAITSTPKRSTCFPRAASTPVIAPTHTPPCSRKYCMRMTAGCLDPHLLLHRRKLFECEGQVRGRVRRRDLRPDAGLALRHH